MGATHPRHTPRDADPANLSCVVAPDGTRWRFPQDLLDDDGLVPGQAVSYHELDQLLGGRALQDAAVRRHQPGPGIL